MITIGMTKLKQQPLRKANNPIIVTHHPVIPVGSEWMKVICLENDVDMMSLLRKHSVRDVIAVQPR
ncbi:hypothetical protein O9992_17325 [Vibrio lentus]|nr:hypothetical protein [Vibrio lentus]